MDHLTITPADEFGRTAVLILHEHGEHVWVNLRFFGSLWYDALPIEDKHTHNYYVEFIYGSWSGSTKYPNHWISAACSIFGVNYTQLDNYFVYAYGSIKNPPAAHLQITADVILAFPDLLCHKMKENMSEVLIDKYLLDKCLAPFDIDSEGTQLTVSMISLTTPQPYSPYTQPCCPTTSTTQDDIVTT